MILLFPFARLLVTVKSSSPCVAAANLPWLVPAPQMGATLPPAVRKCLTAATPTVTTTTKKSAKSTKKKNAAEALNTLIGMTF